MINLRDLEKGLVCLIAREGSGLPNCHEYSVCDCTVLTLASALREAVAVLEQIDKGQWIQDDIRMTPEQDLKRCLEITEQCLATLRARVDFGEDGK